MFLSTVSTTMTPPPLQPCSMLFSQGYCFFFWQEEGGIICYVSTLKVFILEPDKATSILQFLNIFPKIVGLRLVAGLTIEQVSGGLLVYYGTGFGFAVSTWAIGYPSSTGKLLLILIILIIILFLISVNKKVVHCRSCLGKNLILKRLDSLKYFDWINLPSNDYTQVFWSIELLMVAANLLNQTTK